MKRENDKDALEQLFQKYLSEETAGKDTWNNPSDDLLFAALDQVEAPARKRPFPWLWMLLGVFLLVGATLFYQTSTRLNHLDQEINLLQDKVDLQTNLEATGLKDHMEEAQEVIIQEANPHVEEDISIPAINTSTNTTLIPPSSSKKIKKEEAEALRKQLLAQTSETESEETTKIIPTANIEVSEIISLLYLNKENLGAISAENPELEAFVQLPTPSEEIEVLTRKGSTHVFAGTLLSSFRMRGVDGSKPEIFGYDQQRLGFTAGIGVERPISKKMAARHSLSYATFSNKSYYQEEWTFKANRLGVDPNGGNWYDADKPVFTPLGKTQQPSPMAMTDIVPENLDLLDTRADVKQEFHLIELKTGLRYQLLANQKWQVSLDGDFEMKYILGFHEWANIDVTQEKQLIMNNELNSNSKENLNEFLFGVSANMNLEYQWTDRIFTSMEVGAFQPLNSIRKANDGIDTYLNRFKFGLITGFRF